MTHFRPISLVVALAKASLGASAQIFQAPASMSSMSSMSSMMQMMMDRMAMPPAAPAAGK